MDVLKGGGKHCFKSRTAKDKCKAGFAVSQVETRATSYGAILDKQLGTHLHEMIKGM